MADAKNMIKAPSQAEQSDVLFPVEQVGEVLGDSGTQRFSGYFSEEPNDLFRDSKRIDVIEEMRRTDGSIKAVLNAIKAPILAVDWIVEGGDEKTQEFVKEQLFGMRRKWKDFLKEALAYLDFGFYTFEIIYSAKDGKIGLVDIAPRIPRSIRTWKLDNGEFGIVQNLRTDDVKKLEAQIPATKMLILTNDKEGDDVTGQSILRPAYKHYRYKDVLYRIQGIAAERYGVGVPVLTLPKTYGSTEKSKGEEMVQNLRSNEKGYVVLPSEEWKLEILTPKGNPQGQSIDTAIDHHNKMILMSVLANFLGLGTDGTGSYALSSDQSSFFLTHVEQIARYVAEQITEQVIKKLVRYNFGETAEVPHLAFAPLGDIDFKEMSDVLKTLADAGYVKLDGKMVQFAHKMFKLPEISDDELAEMEAKALDAELDAINADATAEFDLPEEDPEMPMDEEVPEEEDDSNE